MPSGNRFGDRGHPHQVGADRAQAANLRWSFITRPEKRSIYTFTRRDRELLCLFERNLPIAFCVGVTHVWKPRTEPIVVRAHERVLALKIDVVADHHQRSLSVLKIDSARRIRENHRANSHPPQHPHWESNFAGGVPFVQVNAALHHRNWNISRSTDDQLSRVANRRRMRKGWNSSVWDSRCIDEFVGEGTQP